MRKLRGLCGVGILVLTVSIAGVAPVSGNPSAAEATPPGVPQDTSAEVSQVELQCIPVAAYWNGPEPSSETPPGPDLAVLRFDIRPKDARVHVDEKFVGRSRYFNGKKGFLFLEPGFYVLELRFDGFQTVRVDLDVQPRCRYDMTHRLLRASSGHREPEEDFGKGIPLDRVFSPKNPVQQQVAVPARSGGPDPRLRNDIDGAAGPPSASSKHNASLFLRVSPEQARVSIDGVFVATAGELASMESPLATSAGEHVVEIRAEGFLRWSDVVELAEGERRDITVELSLANE